ncbi:hypothetical protein F4809DRAFT_642191 [Biscogniauxia mediterranea]|nr:hypothetical protein F4809DRAFT_642191 [Biscogniauxia mediterranea]
MRPSTPSWDAITCFASFHTSSARRTHTNKLAVHWETVPICYLDDDNRPEDTYPLPAHCVYLTRGVDREGTNLILDTKQGTLTEFSHAGSHIAVPYEGYAALPEAEKWRAHRTSSITGLMDAWARRYNKLVWILAPNPIGQPTIGRFYSRAASRAAEEELL